MNLPVIKILILAATLSTTYANSPLITDVTLLDGDVYVEGVMSLYSPVDGDCGDQLDPEVVQNLESVRWTLTELNKNSGSNLYGKQIGLRIHATCRSDQSAENVGLKLATDMKNSSENSFGINSVAVIGPDFSSEAEALSRLLSSLPEKYRLLQLGYAPTSASLKDKTKYRNFFRTIPPDDIQVKVMDLLVQEFNWTYMAIIYENDSYGVSGVTELLKIIKSKDVCFPFKVAIDPSETQDSVAQILDSHLNSLMIQSKISGLLVFGSLKLGTAVMKATEVFLQNNPNVSNPVFLFAESSSYFTGQFRGVSKGAFVLSPPRRTVQEFLDDWTRIFTDEASLYRAIPGNPYIKILYNSTFNCQVPDDRNDYNCPPLTKEVVLEKLQPSLYNQYAIQAAMTVAKVVKEVHRLECGTSVVPCEQLYTLPRQKFIDVLDNFVVKFDDDFTLRLDAFKEPDLQLTFDGSTDVSLPPGFTAYEVYNHQRCASNIADFCFVKVAMLSGDELKVDTGAIKDYTQNGTELLWPDIRKPQCPDNTICTQCIPDDSDEILFIPGDMYIIGIAPVHNIGSSPLKCGTMKLGGVDIVESIRFGIDEAKSTYPDRVPSASIGVIIIDSCNDPQIIQEKVLTIHRLGVFKDGAYIPVGDKILGYVGSWSSDVTASAAKISYRLGFVQISYGSTAEGLSRRSEYPYFLRTSTPDSAQAATMVKIVKYLGFNFIQIMYSETAYGEGGRDLIIEAIKKDNDQICVAQTIGVSHLTNTADMINKLSQHRDAKAVLMFVSSFELEFLIPALNSTFQSHEFLFIASEGWGTRTIVNGFSSMKGTITLTSEIPVNKKFTDYMKGLTPYGSDLNPWIRQYMEYTFDCYYEWSYNKSSGRQCRDNERLDANENNYKIDAWAPFVERAVVALLRGAYTTLMSECNGIISSICELFWNKTALFAENVKNVVINDELGNPTRVFDDNGDGIAGYNIYSVAFAGDSIYESVGSDQGGVFTFNAARWRAINGKSVNSTCGSQPVCKQCFPGDVGTPLPSSTVSSGIIAVITILSLLCCVLAGILLWVCNRHGCCIKIENGNLRLNSAYLTPTYLQRDHRPDGTENNGPRRYTPADKDMENYDTIPDSMSGGFRERDNGGFTGVGAEREQPYMYDRAQGSDKGSSAGTSAGASAGARDFSSGGPEPHSDHSVNIELKDDYISATNT